MIYRIDRKTKKHHVQIGLRDGNDGRWDYVEADADGWIEWFGGECPLPHGHPVDVKHLDGSVFLCQEAGVKADIPMGYAEDWSHSQDCGDIIAYRPTLDADAKPEPPAWDGEGLPPVGCTHKECETVGVYYQDFQCFEVIAHRADCAIVWVNDSNRAYTLRPWHFRPIRSEEDRAIEEMDRLVKSVRPGKLARVMYRAIKNGKIPGVRLDR